MEIFVALSVIIFLILGLSSFFYLIENGFNKTTFILLICLFSIPMFWYLTYQTSTFVDVQKKITYVEGIPCILDDDGKVRALKFLRKIDDACIVRTTTYVFKFGTMSSKKVIDAEFCQ